MKLSPGSERGVMTGLVRGPESWEVPLPLEGGSLLPVRRQLKNTRLQAPHTPAFPPFPQKGIQRQNEQLGEFSCLLCSGQARRRCF